MISINDVPYPLYVKDEESFLSWISSINRKTQPGVVGRDYRELYRAAYFKHDDADSEAFAKALVCQQMAMSFFSHLIKSPNGKIVWRIEPEFDCSLETIPSDLSLRLIREQMDDLLRIPNPGPIPLHAMKKLLGREDWGEDFCTDSIFAVSAPIGEWRMFKSYMRYSILVDDKPVPWDERL